MAEPEITAGGFPTKFRFFRPNAEMIGNFVRPNFEKKKNVFLMIGSVARNNSQLNLTPSFWARLHA